MRNYAVLFMFVTLFCGLECADILAFIPSPFYSHQAIYRPLWRELSKKGHQITLLTTHPMEDNVNITQIHFNRTLDFFEREILSLFKKGFSFLEMLHTINQVVEKFFETQLTEPGLVELLEKRRKFDLFFVEMLLPVYPLLRVKFDCPYIGLSSMDAAPDIHALVGNAIHPAIYPHANFGFMNPLSFEERVQSTGLILLLRFIRYFLFPNLETKLVEKHLGLELDLLPDGATDPSLLFINTNPIFFPSRPVTPVTINLGGGLHLEGPKPLPENLKTYLDDSKDGCIYFSFGSTVTSDFLTPETIDIFRETFEELYPMRVMWKFDNISSIKHTKNIMVRKWLPQQDILRHPNIKLFITQGGLHSMEEAVENAVPVLGMPFYGDQLNNVKMMVSKKAAIELNVKTLTKESLKGSIQELLSNPIYRKNIQKLSAISQDEPMNGLEKAVWWTEYVLRHGGTQHLRSPSADIPLYQYFFLDILALLLTVVIFSILVIYYLIKLTIYIYRRVFKTKVKEKLN